MDNGDKLERALQKKYWKDNESIVTKIHNTSLVDVLREAENTLSIRDCLKKPSMHALIMTRDIARSEVMTVIDAALEILCQSLNITGGMTQWQKEDLVMGIVNTYKHESIEDIVICFRMAKDGAFGTLYNRLDRTIVFDWISKYLDQKSAEREVDALTGNERGYTGEDTPKEIKAWYDRGLKMQAEKQKLDEDYQRKKSQALREADEFDYKEFRNNYLARRKVEENDPGTKDPDVSIPDSGPGEDPKRIRRRRKKSGE